MDDITFIIPVQIDSDIRQINFDWVIRYLDRKHAKNILIAEYNRESTIKPGNHDYIFVEQKIPFFHKARLLNCAIEKVKTPYLAIYDCDVYIPIAQLQTAYDLLSNYYFIFPYDGHFLTIHNYTKYNADESNVLQKRYHPTLIHTFSPGGCFMAHKEKILEVGGYNENFISWAFEDDEIIARIKKLGYDIIRTFGKCYHFEHPRGLNSSDLNPYYQSNEAEYMKVKKMPVDLLKKYILNNFTE